MQFVKPPFQGGELLGTCFEQQQGFRCGLHLALPTIDRLHSRNEGGASGQPLFDEGAPEAPRLFGIGGSGEHKANRRGGIGHIGIQYPSFIVSPTTPRNTCRPHLSKAVWMFAVEPWS
jgi:hypothetical protein